MHHLILNVLFGGYQSHTLQHVNRIAKYVLITSKNTLQFVRFSDLGVMLNLLSSVQQLLKKVTQFLSANNNLSKYLNDFENK